MQAWELFLQKKAQELGKATVDRWLRTLRVVRFDACNLYLEAHDTFQILWFEEHIRDKLKSFVNNNNSAIKVHLSLKNDGTKSRTKNIKKPKNTFGSPVEIQFAELTPYCTFEQFIQTQANFVPYALLEEICTRLAKQKIENTDSLAVLPTSSPHDTINPIYLHGASGSGKTHLLMACAEKLKKMDYKVIYCHADLFTEHVVKAMRAAEMSKFRDIYRQADVLIIDDIHILAKKAATQEEFFHTFNTLHTHGKQIILSSIVSAQNLQFIEPRLISRFEWGCSLQLNCLEKKEIIQLIEKRASFFHADFTPQTIEFLAETFPNNMKSLMRALEALVLRSQIGAKHSLQRAAIALPAAKVLLKDFIEKEKTVALTSNKIVHAVAQFYGIRAEDILGKSQSRECVTPRQVAMYLCRQLLKLPYMKIGDLFSRDHSTVMSSMKQIEKQLGLATSDMAHSLNTIQLSFTNQNS